LSDATFPALTSAVIDLSAVTHNVAQLRKAIAPACAVLAVVKADAYGHGAAPIARHLEGLGIARFGVATVQEGRALRDAGIRTSILVMGAVLPDQLPAVVASRLTPTVHDSTLVPFLAKALPPAQAPLAVHLKVDTGMGRLGLDPTAVVPLIRSEPFQSRFTAEGLMTHLADADNPDPAFTNDQLAVFRTLQRDLHAAGITVPLVHAANSAGILHHPTSHGTMVRPGLMLYGYAMRGDSCLSPDLQPALSLATQIVQIRTVTPGTSVGYNRAFVAARTTRIAVLPVGYADGYGRKLSDKAYVLLHGRRAPVIGRISMDMTTVDVTDIPETTVGDEAVVLGVQGRERITAADLARWLDTIPYEILCGIGRRVPRLYR
jgi:alanine racemase